MTEPDCRVPLPMSAPLACIAVVPPGLEQEAAAELTALGAEAVQPLRRAVAFRCDRAGLYRQHLQSRLPFRILRELARFPCAGPRDLYEAVQRAADWERWLPPQRSFRVEVSGSAPGLGHSHFTALQVKNALVDLQRSCWGERSSVDLVDPDLSLHLHLGRGAEGRGLQGVLSVDGAGASRHRRGWRAAVGLAPLKENLASGLIALTGWDGRVPLVDPLCGSGTLLIEALCRLQGLAPGLEPGTTRPRPVPLQRWPDFDPGLWELEVTAAAHLAIEARARAPVDGAWPSVLGLEHDPVVLNQARGNAERAGVGEHLHLQQGDCRELVPPPGPGLIVCNPPYGARLGEDEDLEALYTGLGTVLKERCSGWTLWLLSGNPELTGALRLKASRRIPISHGGIDCRWLQYVIR